VHASDNASTVLGERTAARPITAIVKPLTTDILAADSALVPIHLGKRQGVERLFPSFVGRHLGISDGSELRGNDRVVFALRLSRVGTKFAE
jgi:hypothetical protein